MTMQAPPAVSIVPHSLQAVLEKLPGKPHAFRVTVDIHVDAGWTVELVPSVPQGINLQIKLLHLKVVHPPDTVSQTIVRRSLHYVEVPPGATYGEVWLSDGDRALSVRVTVVS